MTRIVAGSAKGRMLAVPKSGTRPTSERVREALFSRLSHYDYIEKCNILDLFSGSGALAFEAISRGASNATCVESNAKAAKIISDNGRKLKLPVKVINQKVETYLESLTDEMRYDLVFIDPPYDFSELKIADILANLKPYLRKNAIVVVERAKKAPEPIWPDFLILEDERKWGDTRVWSAVLINHTENI